MKFYEQQKESRDYNVRLTTKTEYVTILDGDDSLIEIHISNGEPTSIMIKNKQY